MPAEIKDALVEEANLQEQLRVVQSKIRKTRDELTELDRKRRESSTGGGSAKPRNPALKSIEDEIDKVEAQVSKVRDALNVSQKKKEQVQHNKYVLEALEMEVKQAEEDFRTVNKKVQAGRAEANEHKKKIEKLSQSAIDKDLRQIDKDIEKAQKTGGGNLQFLQTNRNQLLRQKSELDNFNDLIEEIGSHQAKAGELKTKLDGLKKQAKDKHSGIDFEAFTKLDEDCRAKQGEIRGFRRTLDELRTKKEELRQKAGEAPASPTEDPLGAARGQLRQQQGERDDIQGKIDGLSEKFFSNSVSYADYRNVLSQIMGQDRATIEALESDFLVHVRVDGPSRALVVRGRKDDVEAASAVLKDMLEKADSFNSSTTVSVPEAIVPLLIGKQGSNIDTFRSRTGAKFRVGRKGDVEILGSPEQVEDAKALVLDFVSANCVASVKMNPDLVQGIAMHQAQLLKPIQAQAGCKKIIVNDSQGTVEISGDKGAVAAAEDAVKGMLKRLSEKTIEIELPSNAVASIIGKGGSVLKALEADTSTLISITDGPQGSRKSVVKIRGSSEGALAAKQRIHATTSDEGNSVPYDTSLHGFLTRPAPGEETNPLDRIAKEHGIRTIRAIRDKGTLQLLGQREKIPAAKAALEELLASQSGVAIHFPNILFRWAQRYSDVLRKAHPKVHDIYCDRQNKSVVFNGDAEAVEPAVEELKEALAEEEAKIISIPILQNQGAAIIGFRGDTIRGLERDFQATIEVSKESNSAILYSTDAENRDALVAKVKEIIESNPAPGARDGPRDAPSAGSPTGASPKGGAPAGGGGGGGGHPRDAPSGPRARTSNFGDMLAAASSGGKPQKRR
eukprot:NODE_128_length_2669_cov_250.375954_g104_i0.p1 GENE.NODE_128_length_2669_cov_250.375954_g104_i0~~NODE_128_length_2669_cov_250.375954_g104_i0.p1  ORF type:complete len:864 (+),score=364.85 NODE_128_length_2669_cov_250.375954_g104_i0:57-2594(+)